MFRAIKANVRSRTDWIQNNSFFAKELFELNEEQLSIVADGTYIYCEKSKNNTMQKELYSLHKYRHLVKPFVVCATNGLIVDVFGPYSARVNDAKIMMRVIKKMKIFVTY